MSPWKTQHSENEDHGIWSHHFMGNRWGNSGNSVRLHFGGSKFTADGDCPIIWPPNVKNQFTGKDLDAGKY